jgi:uncharacterized secreted protein with C-terminal beta-propeller domain
MVLKVLFVMVSTLLISCTHDEHNDPCEELNDSAMTQIGRVVEFYDLPKSGLACEEFESRAYSSSPSHGCYVNSSGATEVDDIQHEEGQSMSKQNTVISNILEARNLGYNSKYSFKATNFEIGIRAHQGEGNHQRFLKTNLSNQKIILHMNKLIVMGRSQNVSYVKIYDLSDMKEINHLESYEFQGHLELKLRDDELFIYQSTYGDIPPRITCKDIQYVDNSKGSSLFTIFKLELESSNNELQHEFTAFGHVNHHLDIDNQFIYKSSYYTRQTAILNTQKGEVVMTKVKGVIPNSFSLKEKDDHLIVFTEESNANTMKIFNSNLEKVNELSNIAPWERIFSTRIEKNRAYLVTFKEIDPLFSIDISDVRNPKILGELKIPGVSNYAHVLSDKYLLGFGRSQGRWGDVEVSLFDVEENSAPIRVDLLRLDDLYSLDVFRNHQGITVHGEIISLKSYNQIVVLEKLDRGLVELGRIDTIGYEYEVIIINRELHLYENNGLRIFSLEQGVPELSWME